MILLHVYLNYITFWCTQHHCTSFDSFERIICWMMRNYIDSRHFNKVWEKLFLAGVSLLWLYSIAEYSVDNSIIKPTYMLTYESASELLLLNLEEEIELKILSKAAALRFRWRQQQVNFFSKVLTYSSPWFNYIHKILGLVTPYVHERCHCCGMEYAICKFTNRVCMKLTRLPSKLSNMLFANLPIVCAWN